MTALEVQSEREKNVLKTFSYQKYLPDGDTLSDFTTYSIAVEIHQ